MSQCIIAEGSFVIIYINYDNITSLTLEQGAIFNNKFGTFYHDDIIGLEFGSKVLPRRPTKGFTKAYVHVLKPTPALITESVRHRTQIIYDADISMVLMGLGVAPGKRIVEAGTGSGSLSTALGNALKDSGELFTFEYHQARKEEAEADFKKYGLDSVITIENRDVIQDGLPLSLNGTVDGVFFDLPAPWLAIKHARKALKPGGRICCFSPCIEQVQRNCLALNKDNFQDIQTYECMIKPWGLRLEQKDSEPTEKIAKRQRRWKELKEGAEKQPLESEKEEKNYISFPLPVRGHTSYLTFATSGLPDEALQPETSVSIEALLGRKED